MIIFNQESRQFSTVEDRNFGLKSKLLGAIDPGAWIGKEAAKYAYDSKEEYKKNRWKHAWRGSYAPLQAMRQLKEAKRMHKEGRSPEEIRSMLNKQKFRHVIGENVGNTVAGFVTGGIYNLGLGTAAKWKGLRHAFSKDRKKFD